MKRKLQRIMIAQPSLFLIFVMAQAVFCQQPAPASTAAQTEGAAMGQCALTVDQLPDFHGLRLGMNEAEVRKLFRADSRYRRPESYFSAEGHLRLCVNGCEAPADKDCLAAEPARFHGIAAIHFTQSRGRVEMITVYFETGAMPADAVAFSSLVSGLLGLPRIWRANRYLATMEGNGFRVRIEGGDENKLALIGNRDSLTTLGAHAARVRDRGAHASRVRSKGLDSFAPLPALAGDALARHLRDFVSRIP